MTGDNKNRIGTRPREKYFADSYNLNDAADEVDRRLKKGQLAWIEDDYALSMSGGREWMGYRIKYFTKADIERTRLHEN